MIAEFFNNLLCCSPNKTKDKAFDEDFSTGIESRVMGRERNLAQGIRRQDLFRSNEKPNGTIFYSKSSQWLNQTISSSPSRQDLNQSYNCLDNSLAQEQSIDIQQSPSGKQRVLVSAAQAGCGQSSWSCFQGQPRSSVNGEQLLQHASQEKNFSTTPVATVRSQKQPSIGQVSGFSSVEESKVADKPRFASAQYPIKGDGTIRMIPQQKKQRRRRRKDQQVDDDIDALIEKQIQAKQKALQDNSGNPSNYSNEHSQSSPSRKQDANGRRQMLNSIEEVSEDQDSSRNKRYN